MAIKKLINTLIHDQLLINNWNLIALLYTFFVKAGQIHIRIITVPGTPHHLINRCMLWCSVQCPGPNYLHKLQRSQFVLYMTCVIISLSQGSIVWPCNTKNNVIRPEHACIYLKKCINQKKAYQILSFRLFTLFIATDMNKYPYQCLLHLKSFTIQVICRSFEILTAYYYYQQFISPQIFTTTLFTTFTTGRWLISKWPISFICIY